MATRHCAKRSGRCLATTPRCSGASATRNETSPTISPKRDRLSAQAKATRGVGSMTTTRGSSLVFEVLAAEPPHVYPDATKGLSEGMDETLTMQRLRVRGALQRTLSSTNPIASMIEIVRKTQRHVKRSQTKGYGP